MNTLKLQRPTVGAMTLRGTGEKAVTISAAGQRVIVRPEHLPGLLDDLQELEDGDNE